MKNNTNNFNKYQHIYDWINRFDLSKPKKDFKRDFSDGVLLSEVLNYHYPHVLDLNNYISTCNTKQKYSNWEVLINKILRRIKVVPTKKELDNIIMCKEFAIEKFLDKIYKVIFPGNYSKVHNAKGNEDSESALMDKIKQNQKRINVLNERKQSYLLLLSNAQSNVDKLKSELNCLKEQLKQIEQNEEKDNNEYIKQYEYSNDDYDANKNNNYDNEEVYEDSAEDENEDEEYEDEDDDEEQE